MPKKLTTEDFINKSNLIFGDRFSYEKSIYEDSKDGLLSNYLNILGGFVIFLDDFYHMKI